MMGEKVWGERQLVLLQRAAFTLGAQFGDEPWGTMHPDEISGGAAKAFPLPKVKRPRVAPDPKETDLKWRVAEGAVEFMRPSGTPWTGLRWADSRHGFIGFPLAARIRVWHDLLECPDEEVDE